MLDRKTKDVDASVELLEDRKELNKNIGIAFIGGAFVMVVIGFLSATIDYHLTAIAFYCVAVLLGVISLIFVLFTDHYNILIYLKRKLEDN